ncbi:MAG: hypothetical protein V7607_5749 [Solirubrobacteraceae bacterium]
MTGRDRIMLFAFLGAGLIAGFWFVVLGPKRDEATKLDAKVAVAQQRLQKAQTVLGQAEKAKSAYQADYATVAQLGKAVPKDDNMPSLLYQLQYAAHGARVDFRSVQISGASQAAAPAPAPAAAANAASTSGSGSSASSSSGTASPAPATQAAAASLPPGASVGSAGFPTIPFQFTFRGSFSDMERLLDSVQRFVTVDGKDVRVSGRLLTIDGIALQPQIFPEVKASITATAYLLPASEDATSGATSQGPAASGTAGPSASSSTAKGTTPSTTSMRVPG